jgi:RND family efflux transporter MFP subunit
MKFQSKKFIALLLGGLALLLASCGRQRTSAPQTAETVRGLNVQAVKLERVPDEIEAPGSVVSAATAQVSAQTMGTVTNVAVREGDAVRAGQLLVALDDRELSSRRSAAHAAVEEAKAAREEAVKGIAAAQAQSDLSTKTLERYALLRERKSVSPQEFDEVTAKNSAAQSQLAAARAKQQQVEALLARAQSEAKAADAVAGYTRIVAPFAGVVVRRSVEPGQLATPGVPLVVVEDSSRYRMEVMVNAADSSFLKRGMKARVVLDAMPDKQFGGTVVELEGGADAGSQTVRVKIDLPREAAIRSGLFSRAWFARGETQAIAVPASAIVRRGQLSSVYVVGDAGIIRLRLITLGRTLGDRVEILSGISVNERIVLDAGTRELDGKKLEK